jgi:hypothetical protein
LNSWVIAREDVLVVQIDLSTDDDTNVIDEIQKLAKLQRLRNIAATLVR